MQSDTVEDPYPTIRLPSHTQQRHNSRDEKHIPESEFMTELMERVRTLIHEHTDETHPIFSKHYQQDVTTCARQVAKSVSLLQYSIVLDVNTHILRNDLVQQVIKKCDMLHRIVTLIHFDLTSGREKLKYGKLSKKRIDNFILRQSEGILQLVSDLQELQKTTPHLV